MAHFVHPQALVESTSIGNQTRIWAFAHVLSGAHIGQECNICDHVFIENKVTIGNRVTVKCGVQLWDGLTIEDDVFIGPNVSFCNDAFPRSKRPPKEFAKTVIKNGATIGANATILPGITIGTQSMVGAGSVVTTDVPSYAIVMGNPARITGYVSPGPSQNGTKRIIPVTSPEKLLKGIPQMKVKCVSLPQVSDLRGTLTFGEYSTHLPFIPKRFYVLCDVPTKEVRGENAHFELEQFLVCLKGSVSVVFDDGKKRFEVVLDSPRFGVYFPPMIWSVQFQFSQDCMLLVLASDIYKAKDYIRDYDEFLQEVRRKKIHGK